MERYSSPICPSQARTTRADRERDRPRGRGRRNLIEGRYAERGGTFPRKYKRYTGSPMDLDRVDVVLVRPARAANVAAACRGLKNMGLRSLALVGPPGGLDQPEARALAYGAWDGLDAAVPRASLAQAVAACTAVAGTAGPAHPEAWTPRRLAGAPADLAGPGRGALAFGPGARGLPHERLACGPIPVHTPPDP